MLIFITSIRHPQNSGSYRRIGRLLDATLRSLCRQTDADFRVVVVCNEKPEVSIQDSRIEFVEVGFLPPSLERTPEYGARIVDKGAKLAVGVAAARRHSPDHVMFVDSDDLVDHRLAEFCNGEPSFPGWYFSSGYLHTVRTNFVQLMTPDFHRKCGSSSVIRADLIPVPSDLALGWTKEEVISAVGPTELFRLLGSHGKWDEYLISLGCEMEPLPFPGAVWMVGTGENVSGNLVSSRTRNPIGPDITEAFGLTAPSRVFRVLREVEITILRVAGKVRRR